MSFDYILSWQSKQTTIVGNIVMLGLDPLRNEGLLPSLALPLLQKAPLPMITHPFQESLHTMRANIIFFYQHRNIKVICLVSPQRTTEGPPSFSFASYGIGWSPPWMCIAKKGKVKNKNNKENESALQAPLNGWWSQKHSLINLQFEFHLRTGFLGELNLWHIIM